MPEDERARAAAEEAAKMEGKVEAPEAQPRFEVVEATPEDAERIAYIQRDSWLVTYPNAEAGITREDLEKKFADMPSRVERRRKNMQEASNKLLQKVRFRGCWSGRAIESWNW